MTTSGSLPRFKKSGLNMLQLQALAELETRRRYRSTQAATVIDVEPNPDQDNDLHARRMNPYARYEHAPVRFGTEILGEQYTDDIIKVFESVLDNPVTIARSANGVGKSQPIDTMIPTPDGWRKIGDLEAGDFVFSVDGQPTLVTGIYPQGTQETYKITFNDGSSTRASKDHLWLTRSSSDKYRDNDFWIATTKELIKYKHRVLHIPMTAPVQYLPQYYFIDPYIIGILISEGGLNNGSCRFDTSDTFVVDEVKRLLRPNLEVHWYCKTHYGIVGVKQGVSNPILTELSEIGLKDTLSDAKFIPGEYLVGSVGQRISLLQGLMDGDGYIDKRGIMVYTTVSQELAIGVVELVQSLGGVASISTKTPSYTDKNGDKVDGKLAYNVCLNIVSFCPFRLPRKAKRFKEWKGERGPERRKPYRVISEIERIENCQSVCISVAHPSKTYLTEKYIVTHNTHCAARIAVWFYKVFEDAQVYTTSPPPVENLQKLLWGEIGSLQQSHPRLFEAEKTITLHIERHPQSFITGVTIPLTGTSAQRKAKFSGKHAPHLLFIVDEGDAVPDEVYEGIETCMSGGHARLLIMFNPRHESGPVYRMERDGQGQVIELSALRHPNVVTGKDLIPGAVDRPKTLRRINEWSRPLTQDEKPNDECFNVDDLCPYLVGEVGFSLRKIPYPPLPPGWRKVTNSILFYIVLGLYSPMGEMQLISLSWINDARARWDSYVAINGTNPPKKTRPIMGQDVAEFGDDDNVVCFRYGGWVAPFVTWGDMDTDASATKGANLYKSRNALHANVDATGVGAGVAPKMRRLNCQATGVKVASSPTEKTEMGEFYIMRDQLWWAVREWLRTDPGAMLPPDELLLEELATPTYEVTTGRVRVMSKDLMKDLLKRSPDRADSLCLTFAPATSPFRGGWV